jgi:hypothetical protein
MNKDYNPNVYHPAHYNTNSPKKRITHAGEDVLVEIECIDVIRDMPTWKGNAFKYLWRAGLKHEDGMDDRDKEIEDLQKAKWYINDRLSVLTHNP